VWLGEALRLVDALAEAEPLALGLALVGSVALSVRLGSETGGVYGLSALRFAVRLLLSSRYVADPPPRISAMTTPMMIRNRRRRLGAGSSGSSGKGSGCDNGTKVIIPPGTTVAEYSTRQWGASMPVRSAESPSGRMNGRCHRSHAVLTPDSRVSGLRHEWRH